MKRTVTMDVPTVRRAYARWAPVYDSTFGRASAYGRRQAVNLINLRRGNVLEVGVGTGLSLPGYARHLRVVGIDLCPEMLDKARRRVRAHGLEHVDDLIEMDACHLGFPDATFDTVVAMYVMTVVPQPEHVMSELDRVCKPGGQVILLNHFSQAHGLRGWAERRLAPFARVIGWRPVFDLSRVMGQPDLTLVERRSLRPLGLFTLLRFAKAPVAASVDDAREESTVGQLRFSDAKA